MRIFDISLPLSSALPVWPGDPRVTLKQVKSLNAGGVVNVSHLTCSVHSGTHVDAPYHFIVNGVTVDKLPIDVLIGSTYVCYFPDVDEISSTDLERLGLPQHTQRLLLRTRNSKLWAEGVSEFKPDYVALTAEAAEWVVEQGIRLLGVDGLSVQRFHDPEPTTHRILLAGGVIVVEGLNLNEVLPGLYELICLPLKLVGSDGAPARVILLGEE